MDYIKQLNAFWKWRELHDISHTQLDIYLALLDVFNRAFWKPELSIPNRTIMSKADISDKKQLADERSKLVELGLIIYTTGDRKKAGSYSIVTLYDTEEQPQNNPEISPDFPPELPPINKTENIKQKTKTKTDIHTSADSDSVAIQTVFDAYNDICKSLPKAEKLTDKRKKQIAARLKTYSIEQIKEAFIRAEQSDFMRGITGNWRATLDWFMGNDGNILKVIEGNYDNNSTPKIPPNFTPNNTPNEMTPTEGVDEIQAAFMAAYQR
ncbi:MAG: hypothetical protein J1G06_08600 [Oscillospiraceae bacterium]|nr:hypothetical protein [Oscillospiraceae bacterium]